MVVSLSAAHLQQAGLQLPGDNRLRGPVSDRVDAAGLGLAPPGYRQDTDRGRAVLPRT